MSEQINVWPQQSGRLCLDNPHFWSEPDDQGNVECLFCGSARKTEDRNDG